MASNLHKIKALYGVDPDYPQRVQKVAGRQPQVLTLKEWQAVPEEDRHLGRYDADKNAVLMATEKYPVVGFHGGGPSLFRRLKPGIAVLPAIPE